MRYQFTSESVSEGHPDKVADAISDAVANYLLCGKDTNRAAIETLVTTNLVVLAGEYKTDREVEYMDIKNLVRQTIQDIGYEQTGFHWSTVEVRNHLHGQSADIALGTDDFGAGDQGIMFGYACRETPDFMPAPIHYAHKILRELTHRRKTMDNYDMILPDSKAQVTFNYEDGLPVDIDTILVSTQHTAHADGKEVTGRVMGVIHDVVPEELLSRDTKFLINPTGRFVIGGPDGDTGLTGRKIIVDTYGGAAPHGGGAFSGKDGTKVDRTAAYMARHVAKNILMETVFDKCLVQLSYAIGVKDPTSVTVWIDGDYNEHWSNIVRETYDLTPKGMIDYLKPNAPENLLASTNYGHFGEKDVSWEKKRTV